MSKVQRWNDDIDCPRWVKTSATKAFETEDIIYPDHIPWAKVEELPEFVQETYEECAGTVNVQGYYDPGNTYGDPYYCYPPEGETYVGMCSECGDEDWSKEELKQFEEKASEA